MEPDEIRVPGLRALAIECDPRRDWLALRLCAMAVLFPAEVGRG